MPTKCYKTCARKILVTVVMVILSRLLCQMPVYGIDRSATTTLLKLLDSLEIMSMVSGGMLNEVTVGTIGITPYVTSSIMIQFFIVLIPKFQKLQRNGYYGQKMIKRYTFYMTTVFAAVQSTFMVISINEQNQLTSKGTMGIAIIQWILAALTLALIGEYIQEQGIGNGFSVLIMVNILTRCFYEGKNLMYSLQAMQQGKRIVYGTAIMLLLLYLVFAYYLQESEIRIPVVETQTEGQDKMKGYIPVKLNIANIMPVLMTSTIFSLVSSLTSACSFNQTLLAVFDMKTWFTGHTYQWLFGIGTYIILLLFFTAFYAEYNFNPMEVATQLRHYGMYVEGIHPGGETVDYFTGIIKKIRVVNSVFLSLLIFLPLAIMNFYGLSNFSLFGSSIVIVISVLSDMGSAIRAEMACTGKTLFTRRMII
ncbi:MAG: preprotein translocase subunit SecY [Oliverpabstia sp.]